MCGDAAQLRGFEGEAASVYFGVFNQLILQQKKDFVFSGRNKRPPLDNVNAMLSFVYTCLLYTSMRHRGLKFLVDSLSYVCQVSKPMRLRGLK